MKPNREVLRSFKSSAGFEFRDRKHLLRKQPERQALPETRLEMFGDRRGSGNFDGVPLEER